ncbi:hypothetical protein ACWD48_04430 [Streptomyces sp. NPDC002519]
MTPVPPAGTAPITGSGTAFPPPSGAPGRMRRLIAAALLVLIPAGHLAISADRSRRVAAAHKLRAERGGPVRGIPSAVQRAVCQVPVPSGASGVAFFEATAWEKDSLYAQFTTTPAGLTGFLRRLGAGPARLRDGLVGLVTVKIPARQSRHVRRALPGGSPLGRYDADHTGSVPGSRDNGEPRRPAPAYRVRRLRHPLRPSRRNTTASPGRSHALADGPDGPPPRGSSGRGAVCGP